MRMTKLESYMKSHGWSATRLARECGVNPSTVHDAIHNCRNGYLYTWMLFAETMGCTLDDICGEPDEGMDGENRGC